jgi:2-polyprenyl-6-methoxyphenol hydroxylase-like FAD-dependent oxidoreductase
MPQTTQNTSVPALIVGAGPVGLTMAAELTRYGVGCRLIEKNPAPNDKSKALVLWSRTLELLQKTGPVEAFLRAGRTIDGASVYGQGRRLAHLELDGVASPYPRPLMLPQCDTERLLAEHLATQGIRAERSVELVGFDAGEEVVVATLAHADGRRELVDCQWLLGCDGAHSTVRHGLGIEFAGSAEQNDWMLADVHVEGPVVDNEVSVFWHEEGVLIFFPITADRFRIVADVGQANSLERPADPTLEEVQRVLDVRGPGGIRLSNPVWLAGFRINERKVSDYRHGRVFLAGDAAHIHSPAGGQGMNTGMQDAYNLAWKLALVHAGLGRDAPLLDSYSAERSAVGDQVLRAAGRLTQVATLRNPLAQSLRNHMASIVTSFGAVREHAKNALTELAINYRGSALVGEHRGLAARSWLVGGGVHAGDRLPDARIADARSGAAAQLFHAIGNNEHNLLLIAGAQTVEAGLEELAALGRDVARAYPNAIAVHLVLPTDASPLPADWPGRVWRDQDSELRNQHAVRADTLVLVRPDGYVGFRSQPAELPSLLAHLDKYLIAGIKNGAGAGRNSAAATK